MRRFAVGVIVVAALSVAAPAWADMRATFGNTIISTYADGGTVKHYFTADGGYSAVWSSGRQVTGRWVQEGNRVCLNNIRPRIMMMSSFCTPLIEAGVGDTWQARDPLGRRVTNRLVRGRQ